MTKASIEFTNYIKNKKIDIIGAGISNTPLVKLFYDHGCKEVTVRDAQELSQSVREGFEKHNARIISGADYLKDISGDIIIRTPGLRPDRPELEKAKNNGAEVIGETQLFLKFKPCTVFGVTGSDGKTTTTTLISKLLEASRKKVYLGGNIGTPLLPLIDEIQPDDFACMELSSFQLSDAQYSPDVSVITNISENHLDWHTDMQEYIDAKANIFIHQNEKGLLILNADDPHSKYYASLAKGKVEYFSMTKADVEGCYLSNGILYSGSTLKKEALLSAKDIRIPGSHNVANYLTALCATKEYIKRDIIQALAKSFNGVEHRIEYIRTLDGVDYYNSSIDSSPARTIATLKSFDQKLIVICGGYDKNLNYSVLKEYFEKHVKAAFVTGQTCDKILKAVSYPDAPYHVKKCKDIKDALENAKAIAKSGDKIILTPASASFDSFKNFEERGRYFKELVNEL